MPQRHPLLSAAVAFYRTHRLLERTLERAGRCAQGFVTQALTPDEKNALSVALYSSSGAEGAWQEPDLWAWEKTWYANRLPAAPARVLLGGCGGGREAVALARSGFQLDAFEPAASLAAVSRQRLAGSARVFSFRYQDLSAAVLDADAGPAARLAEEHYDAVVLGWGSLTHIADCAERERLLRALSSVCPTGPILASFWLEGHTATPKTPGPWRAERLGSALGRAARRFRRLPDHPGVGEYFWWTQGFGYAFSREEIENLAKSIGRHAVWETPTVDNARWIMPHMSFVVGADAADEQPAIDESWTASIANGKVTPEPVPV